MVLYIAKHSETGEELIDTLWNVNKRFNETLFFPSGINRYIMECKFHTGVMM